MTSKRDLPHGPEAVARVLDVVEEDILPLVRQAVAAGNKIFGAAILKKSDLSLVTAAANDEAEDPLRHGEIHAIMRFHEMPDASRPAAGQCLFVSTHEPCSMCLSALAWSGFDNFYYLFSHEHSRDLFDIPHDLQILKEVFGLDDGTYHEDNAYWTAMPLAKLVRSGPADRRRELEARIAKITQEFEELGQLWQRNKSKGRIPLD